MRVKWNCSCGFEIVRQMSESQAIWGKAPCCPMCGKETAYGGIEHENT